MLRSRLKQLVTTRRLPKWIESLREQDAWIILCYHRFESEPGRDPIPGMAVTPDTFRLQVDFLRSLGPVVSLDDGLRGGEGLRFSLTFDDGYRDNHGTLLPMLGSLELPVTIYCTTDFVGGRIDQLAHDRTIGYDAPPMNRRELRELAASPWVTIGAHSATHPDFTHLLDGEWSRELGSAKSELEGWIERPVEHFAYTYGPLNAFDWDAGPDRVREAGYRTLASNAGGLNPSTFTDHQPIHLRRVPSIASPDRESALGWVMRNALR